MVSCLELSPMIFIISLHFGFMYVFGAESRAGQEVPKISNCSLFKDDEMPVVRIYDASEEPPQYSENTWLKVPEKQQDILGWPGLECWGNRAVRWIYDNSYEKSGFDESASRTTRISSDFFNVSSYLFLAQAEFKFRSRVPQVLFVCATFAHPCHRRVVQIQFVQEQSLFRLRLLERNEEVNGGISEHVAKLMDYSDWQSTSLSEFGDVPSAAHCDVTFTFATSPENRIIYAFNPSDLSKETVVSEQSSQSLANSFRLAEQLNENCVFKENCALNTSNHREQCRSLDLNDAHTYWPLVFHLSIPDKNISRVVRIYSTIRNGSDFSRGVRKYSTESTDFRDFMLFEPLPQKLALQPNGVLHINCRWPPYLFSFGTRVAYQFDGSPVLNLIPEDRVTEYRNGLEDSKYLVASAQLSFNNVTYIGRRVTVYCFAPLWNSTTIWVNVSQEIELTEPAILVRGESPVFTLPVNSRFTTTCEGTGPPVPELEIVSPQNLAEISVTKVTTVDNVVATITIENVDERHAGRYNCVGTSDAGTDFHEFEIRVRRSETQRLSLFAIILFAVLGIISIPLTSAVVFLVRKFRNQKLEVEEAAKRECADIQMTTEYIHSLPYFTSFEVSYLDWAFYDILLGVGSTGIVRKGVVKLGITSPVVAIKSVKSPDDINCFRAALHELKMLSYVGHHDNVVKLIAVTTDHINARHIQLYTGVEYCADGSLLKFLRDHKTSFRNLVGADGGVDFAGKTSIVGIHAGDDEDKSGIVVSTTELFQWSLQIAFGMEFLESKRILHVDLAARNILLDAFLVAKISDFGLAQELPEDSSEYLKTTESNLGLPWKWMAIESLRENRFSSKSDVWSYGVMLHEIFTLGDEPYPGLSWTEEFMSSLENGMRLEQPEFGTNELYEKVMIDCWNIDPDNRISFSGIVAYFQEALSPLWRSDYAGVS